MYKAKILLHIIIYTYIYNAPKAIKVLVIRAPATSLMYNRNDSTEVVFVVHMPFIYRLETLETQ